MSIASCRNALDYYRALSVIVNQFHVLGKSQSNHLFQHQKLLNSVTSKLSPRRQHVQHVSTTAWRSPVAAIHEDSTIYALSTASGRAAIAIIRISGPACIRIYEALCPSKPLPKPRYAVLRTLHSPTTLSLILDSGALVLYFPGPNTSTGDSVLELHIHGGPAVIRAVLTAISTLHTPSLPVRYAQPGEFTRRAFLADRMSLPQIEALGDTLTAETEEQRRISVAGTRSGLAARYDSWRAQLLSARGELEALIDFSEDQHFDESPAELASNVAQLVRGLARVMDLHVANAVRGELLRAGIKLSLIGAPNVGKSSLLNQIVGRRAAIVSAQAGTTRDVVEVGVDLGGFFCRLGDTAGLRRTNEAGAIKTAEDFVGDIEAEGIRRAKERAMESDVVVLVASVEETDAGNHEVHFDSDVLETAQGLLQQGTRVVVAINKIDRLPNMNLRDITDSVTALLPNMAPSNIFPISCRLADESPSNLASSSLLSPTTASTPISSLDPGHMQLLLTGLTSLFRTMTSAVLPPAPSSADAHAEETTDPADSTFRAADASTYADALSATARQRNLLEACMRELQTFLSLVDASNGSVTNSHSLAASDERGGDVVELDLVLAAESLRAAASCLAQITGKGGDGGDVEEVLGVVFERFCVGK